MSSLKEAQTFNLPIHGMIPRLFSTRNCKEIHGSMVIAQDSLPVKQWRLFTGHYLVVDHKHRPKQLFVEESDNGHTYRFEPIKHIPVWLSRLTGLLPGEWRDESEEP